ncbi:MAG TPA: tetratricopeptide repeat protein [Kribbellaceae bacterium]|nr:tetratricopeptide repeat protein [Kribbellaceae bacterium]
MESFVLACASYATAHRIDVAATVLDLDRWHADYRTMENTMADREAQREQISGGVARIRKRRVVVAPGQLPADVPAFTGRTQHLSDLDRLISRSEPQQEAAGRPTAVVISAIDGTAGVGKTALAIHWSHRVREYFPDGQLYVNLRGFDPSGQAMDPADAVRGFLDAFEVPPQRIPTDPDARAALYRSLLVGRKILVVLDNARDSGQVRPLLPGDPGCLVIVTSRNQLTGLVAANAACPLTLDVLSGDEAREFLARRLGASRIAAEPQAVEDLIELCARLPLALAITAAHAATRPNVTLEALATQIRNTRQRLDFLTGDDAATNLQVVFSWSYHTLTPAAARLFRLLGLHPGPDISAPAAASLAGLTPDAIPPVLAELTRASLLTQLTTGRYTFHDLLRDYATYLADSIDTDEQRHTATGRILDHYLHTAYPAARLLDPNRDPVPLALARAGVTPEQMSDHAQALGWFAAQRQVLLAAVTRAAATGFDTHTWQLASTLVTFLYRRGDWHDQVAVGRAAVAAAQRLADPTTEARTHRFLAGAYIRLGRFEDALTQLRHALDLDPRSSDQTQQAHTYFHLAYLWERRSQPARALPHARQALHLYQAAGHQAGQARALNTVGWYHTLLGEHQQALTHCQQAMTLFQQLGDRVGQAATWDTLGYAHHHLGQHTQAVTCYQHALTLSRDLGDRYAQAEVLTHLGDTHHATDYPQAARDAWQQALTILDDLDHPDAETTRAKLAALN